MVNFGPLAAEIVSLVWGTPGDFNGFRVLAALLHGTLVVSVSQTAAFNRGRHLYSAGRLSRWALAHISSFALFHRIRVRCRRKTINRPIPRFQNLLLMVSDHIDTICAIIQRVFGQNDKVVASTSDCSCLCPCLLMSFLYRRAGHVVQYGGFDGRVHCNYGGLIKLGLMDVGAGISLDA